MSRTRLQRLGGRRGVLVGLLLVVVLGVVGIFVLGGRERVTDYGSSTSESAPPPERPERRGRGGPRLGGRTRSRAGRSGLGADRGRRAVAGAHGAAVRRRRRPGRGHPAGPGGGRGCGGHGGAGVVDRLGCPADGPRARRPARPADRLDRGPRPRDQPDVRRSSTPPRTSWTSDARVASQRASVDRVRALLSEARSIGDVVAIESELTRREADLDSLTGRLDRAQGPGGAVHADGRRGEGADHEDGARRSRPASSPGWPRGGRACRRRRRPPARSWASCVPFLPVVAVLLGLVWVGRRIARTRRTPAGGAEGPGA